jgi:hypothetical protein
VLSQNPKLGMTKGYSTYPYLPLYWPYRRSPSSPRNVRLAYSLLFLWVVALILSPIYVFESGAPQPANIIVAVLILLLSTTYFIPVVFHTDLYLSGLLFLCTVVLVNGFTWAVYNETHFIMSSLYYAYNMSAMVLVISLFKEFRNTFVNATRVALLVATLFELGACLFLSLGDFRAIGTFNNPNQLGYWSLLVAACLLVLRGKERMELLDLTSLAALGYLCVLSLSKAATGGFLLLVISALFFQGVRKRWGLILAPFVVLFSIVWLTATPQSARENAYTKDSVVARFISRFEGSASGTAEDSLADSLAMRGYDRILRYPEHLIFGAGEGAYWRFTYSRGVSLDDLEMHSTFGTILFSYGVLGAVFFAFFLWVIFRRAMARHLIYFLPICFYGLTHQGLRFFMLWVFLGLVFAATRYHGQIAASRQGLTATVPEEQS